ncbi:translocation protein TolB [Halodesulfovibrio sp.]|uniref:translocation protein TolB n=1 Tax=Halodesulfovibrio sp. TaxID=1912772 RepID=UPI0025D8B68F|nr:translocation protein TolB [Halodesulfovibrio sp.]MCT4535779.1 translocation protein TolB [Halodesulfovibrio sp.]
MKRIYILTLLLCMAFATATSANARSLEIDIYGPGQNKINLIQSKPVIAPQAATSPQTTESAAELTKLIHNNLFYLPFMNLIQDHTILGGNTVVGGSGKTIDFKKYQLASVDLLITEVWPDVPQNARPRVELRAFEVFTGKLVLGKAYSELTPENLPNVADRFCSALMKKLTGRGEFFLSTLAFVKKSTPEKKDIWTVRPTGRELNKLTNMSGLAMSPTWSPDGRYILFSHIGKRFHSLGIWDRLTQRVQKVKFPGNTIIGPAFLPDNKVAVSLAAGGNPDIYLLNHKFKREKTLVQNWAIDVSPSFDATGKKMVFVSSRRGNPHIFLKDLKTGKETRITRNGKYNTSPSISPDGELVVFARRTSQGHRIFALDLVTGKEKQITFGPGDDEMPAFGPDGFFVAFSSNRSGEYKIYLTTRHGGTPRMVKTGSGEATLPAWGMIPAGSGR